MAYLLREIGLDSMMIQRAHYSIKKRLSQQQQLEFGWLQQWDHSGSETSILCHLMPFYSYDIPHTCGPEPKVKVIIYCSDNIVEINFSVTVQSVKVIIYN